MAATISLQILDSIKQPASLTDRNYNYTFVNQAFCDYHQKAREEIIGSPVASLIGKECFMNQVKPYIDRCLKGEEVSYQYIPWISGYSEFINQIHLYPCYSDNGAIDGVISISEDQPDQQSIKELRAREREFRMLTENSTDIIYTTGLNQNFTYVSPSIEYILGYTVEEAMAMKASDIMTKASYQEQLEAFRRVLTDPHSSQETTEIKALELVRKDGSKILGEVNARLLFDKSHKPCGILGICRDITQRKKDEQHRQNVEWLSRSAQDYLELPSVEEIYQYIGKNLTELVPHSLIIINDINEQKETVTPRYIFGINNNTFRKVINTLGMNPIGKEYPFAEELKDCYKKQKLVDFQGGLDEFSFGYVNKALVRQVEKLLNLKSIYTIGLRRDNRLFSAIHVFKFNTSEIQYFNMVETFLNQASIALQRKMLENELREAKEKAEENERLKTAFLANLSHEIRTPLNIILGYVQLLDNANLMPEDKKQYINAIHNSSDHLIDIIDDVLSMAKLDTGQHTLKINPFNLNALILEICLSFESKARRKNIHFDSFTPLPDDQSVIQSDENKIRQILANLLNNAFKFTPEEGNISFGYSATNHHINFFVKDNGIGISEEHHKKIFERFTQVEDSNQRKYEGTGLGLPISRGLVELLGGSIQVESQPGKGSTFTFVIPLRR
ncbi:MAG: PAS domain-containing sensor histidine kinase [Bacteroidota bacterium]